jgi:hypothetical protein
MQSPDSPGGIASGGVEVVARAKTVVTMAQ